MNFNHTEDQEKALRELGSKDRSLELDASTPTEVDAPGKLTSSGRFEAGGSSMQDKIDEAEDQRLVRRRISPSPSSSADTGKEIDCRATSIPQHNTSNTSSQRNKNDSHLNEWGGISSLEHDEAVMLEAALFGGIPEGNAYHVPYAPGLFRQNDLGETDGSYPRHTPRPPSPSLTAQRLIREQHDDEYFASLQADREKKLKAREESEIRRLEEQAATEYALIEERQKQEELQRKLEEHQVRPYPRRAFSDGESAATLDELGLSGKQEALFLELI